jgi:AcrR family transcriptional regulator
VRRARLVVDAWPFARSRELLSASSGVRDSSPDAPSAYHTTYIPTVQYILSMVAKLDRRSTEAKAQSADLGSSREQLLTAASRVFARRGYHGASISEIAAEAGFSKGALYWNFANKEDLFFALLDELDEHLRTLITASARAPTDQDTTEEIGRNLSAVLENGRDVVLLFHEYSALAVRDPKLAARYAKRNARLRDELAASMQARHEATGTSLAIPAEHIATAVIALVDGLSMQQLTEPGAVPEDLFGQIFSLIEDGMSAREKEPT